MRILTLSYEFPPIGGGGSGVVKGLSEQLVGLGHTVDVVTMGFSGLPAQEKTSGINVFRIACDRRSESKCTAREALRYVLRARKTVRRLLQRNRYDIVHTHFIFPDGLIALREAAPARVPFIITAHGSDVPGYNQKAFFRIAHPFLTLLWRRVTQASAVIVSPSKTLAELIESARPGAPVVVIPNGISGERFIPTEKKEQILVATRLVERKGVQYLLRALVNENIEWPTIIVGSGEYGDELTRLNDDLGQPAEMIGWLSNESDEFRDLLQESAAYVLPSNFENFPVSLLEAMAAGSAIVTTKGNGCEEAVGDTAELVTTGSTDEAQCIREIGAALRKITTDSAHRNDLGRRARQRLEEKFTWNAVSEAYLDEYRRHALARGQ